MSPGRHTAHAHADYDHSDPAADATVTTAPTSVQIWFTEELFRRQGQNGIEVQNAAGERVDVDDAAIDDDDRTLMTVSLAPNLADGVYQVHWRTTSADDGHEGEGDFVFTVGAAGTVESRGSEAITATNRVSQTENLQPATPMPTSTPIATSSPSPSQRALPCTGAALPFTLMLGAVWMRHRRVGIR
ncbi:MAG: copper resistance protein CopC [Caldilineaceae bacterium]